MVSGAEAQHGGRQVKGLTCPCGREHFFQEEREGRKKVWVMIQRKLKEFGRKLWEFSSDVLNFPREVGGEVISVSKKAG